MPTSVKQLLATASQELADIADSSRSEAKILLAFALEKDALWLMTHDSDMIEDIAGFESMVARRKAGEPIEYITNLVSFYSETFYAAPGALIARPETEILIDKVLEKVPADFRGHIVEVGVGSGIISIILALHLKEAKFSAVDISPAALAVAKENIARFELSDRIILHEGDLLSPISEKIDVVVSNPPYIEAGVFLEKPLAFEPQNALFGGTIGDEILKRLIDEAQSQEIGLLACEMGYDQKAPLGDYMKSKTSYNVTFYKDLADFDRGFVMEYKGS